VVCSNWEGVSKPLNTCREYLQYKRNRRSFKRPKLSKSSSRQFEGATGQTGPPVSLAELGCGFPILILLNVTARTRMLFNRVKGAL